jgi:hypothetical protein
MFPSPPSFEELEQSPKSPEADSSATTRSSSVKDRELLVTGWFFYLGEIALKRLTNRILLHRYESSSRVDGHLSQIKKDADLERSVAEFDLQLQQW